MRKTKIICTLGPAVDTDEKIRELMLNGMDCARINFSHGTHEEQKVRMDRVKRIRQELGINLPILLDTKGPEIRVRDFKDGKAELKKGNTFTLKADPNYVGDEAACGLTFPNLAKNVKAGDAILIDDGSIRLTVKEIVDTDVVCVIENDGIVKNKKSINIPNVVIEQPYLSEVDKSDILFGISQDVDFIAASFMRRPEDAIQLKNFLRMNDGEQIKIIAKIENTEGIEKIDEIIELVDGIMVARGDMGVEVAFEKLPAIQKKIISKCFHLGKLCVTATQMLESMTTHPTPTRAEVSDVANAVYERTTAIMLSGETASGMYPIEAVKTMAKIAETAEENINHKKRFYEKEWNIGHDILNAISNSAVNASYQIGAKAIIAVTMNGKTGFAMSNYKPECPIIAVTKDEKACRQLNLAWNVRPVVAEEQKTTDEIFLHGISKALETGLVRIGDCVIITGGSKISKKGTDTFSIHYLK